MSELSNTRSYRTSTMYKMLIGIILLLLSLAFTNVSVAYRLCIGFSAASTLLEGGQRLLTQQNHRFAQFLGWLSWACFLAGFVAGAFALYQLIIR